MRTDQAYNWLLLPIERNAKGRLEIHYTRINGRGLVERILAYSRHMKNKSFQREAMLTKMCD